SDPVGPEFLHFLTGRPRAQNGRRMDAQLGARCCRSSKGTGPAQLLVLGPAPTFQIVAGAVRVLVGFCALGGAMTGFSLRLIGRCSSAISANAIWHTAGVCHA